MKDEQNHPLALGLLSGIEFTAELTGTATASAVYPGLWALGDSCAQNKQGRLTVQVARRQGDLFPAFPRHSEKQTQPLAREAGLKM